MDSLGVFRVYGGVWADNSLGSSSLRVAAVVPSRSSGSRWEALLKLRREAGWNGSKSVRTWNKEGLAELRAERGGPEFFPRNLPILDFLVEKFRCIGFQWKIIEVTPVGRNRRKLREPRKVVSLTRTPRIGGHQLSLYEMWLVPLDLVDEGQLPTPLQVLDSGWV